jgi:4-methyl-5(b-hydroxyethyl)-thiazole monophosphate biosynthesis
MQGKETDMKAAVLMKSGYEEGETLTIVDLLRRAGFECDTFYFDEPFVEGMHHMLIKADQPFHENTIKEYDLLILPGGRPGGANLANDPRVIELVRSFDAQNKYLGALCSGTMVLQQAGVLKERKVTGYTGYGKKLTDGQFTGALVEVDQNLITSQGPASPYPFAFRIMELFGVDPAPFRHALMYDLAKGR